LRGVRVGCRNFWSGRLFYRRFGRCRLLRIGGGLRSGRLGRRFRSCRSLGNFWRGLFSCRRWFFSRSRFSRRLSWLLGRIYRVLYVLNHFSGYLLGLLDYFIQYATCSLDTDVTLGLFNYVVLKFGQCFSRCHANTLVTYLMVTQANYSSKGCTVL
jgi:hypothetical protein